MHKEFHIKQQPTIYDPTEFAEFCKRNGAPTLFYNLCKSMNDVRHSEERKRKNEYVAMNVIYELCYGRSQKCNYLQKDHGMYLKMCHTTQEGLDTEKRMGNTVTSRTVENEFKKLAERNAESVNNAISLATENGWLIVCIIDDYTTIHAKRRPTQSSTSKVNNMCTIVCRIFPEINAIPLTSLNSLQNPLGVDVCNLQNELSSEETMHNLAMTFCDRMPEWFATEFFSPEAERNRLHAHMYSESNNVRKMRCLNNVHLIEFTNLQLKSTSDFQAALEILGRTKMRQYMTKYALIIPGDWPAQFHVRKVVYSRCPFQPPVNCRERYANQNTNTPVWENEGLHHYAKPRTSDDFTNPSDRNFTDPLQAAVPMIGPLHISLNSRETLMQNFHSFFKYIYESLFPKQKLADKPKPWRTSLLLEVVYGGWTLIRPFIKKSFRKCKHPLHGILLNLLDNYIPLVLSIYSVVFRLNSFAMYLSSMISVWVLFYCFRRHHYNKAPLVWLSNVLFWKKSNPDLYRFLQTHITTTDEYPVENTHSIIRAQTVDGDDASMLQKKAKAVFQSKRSQHNFRSNFTPPKNYTFSQNQLQSLKLKTSEKLAEIFSYISMLTPDSDLDNSPLGNMLRSLSTNFPNTFPFGYHTNSQPDPFICCDMPGCTLLNTSEEWLLIEGCFHSFHIKCLKGASFCPICSSHIKTTVGNLATTAQNSIFEKTNVEQDSDDNHEVAEDKEDTVDVDSVWKEFVDMKIEDLSQEIANLKPYNPTKVSCNKFQYLRV